jgi:hypothetical protein
MWETLEQRLNGLDITDDVRIAAKLTIDAEVPRPSPDAIKQANAERAKTLRAIPRM